MPTWPAPKPGWEQRRFLDNPEIGLVVLDELNIALQYAYLDLAEVLHDISRPEMQQHVIVTGRGAPGGPDRSCRHRHRDGVVKHAFWLPASPPRRAMGLEPPAVNLVLPGRRGALSLGSSCSREAPCTASSILKPAPLIAQVRRPACPRVD